MGLIYAGIDEAGYGPMLGPLCVGLAVFRVEDHAAGANAPDLWDVLKAGVCRSLKELRTDSKHRVVVADSKVLKLSNQSKTRHPLLHLERAALSLLGASGVECPDDAHLFAALGSALPKEPWYAGERTFLPLATTADDLKIATNVLRCCLNAAGVELLELRCTVVGEREFNSMLRKTGSKAEVVARAVASHIGLIRERWGAGQSSDEIRIACDRLGGRATYTDLLRRALPGVPVSAIAESPELSAYELGSSRGPGSSTARALFMTESETHHLPVAVASIAAKLVRELAMRRLNAHFGEQLASELPELKPTAGYVQDARRWLGDVEPYIDDETRERLVRLA
ncbi:MAG: hypothetical protein AAFO89_07550 [Planctomycetota bacterium]